MRKFDTRMTEYPLVIRNRAPLFFRTVMVLFLCAVILMIAFAFRDGPPEPRAWWPLIVLAFIGGGLFGLFNAMNEECAVVRINGPNSITIERGPAFRRVQQWTDRARFWVKDRKDSDGVPYFELMMDTPGEEPLCIAQSPRRWRVEQLQARIEAAFSGLSA